MGLKLFLLLGENISASVVHVLQVYMVPSMFYFFLEL